MVAYTATHINKSFALADGDTLYLDIKYPVRVLVAAVSASITMSVEVIDGSGNYRDMTPVIATTGALISSDIWPPLTRFKFTGGTSEVKVYGA